MRPDTEQPDDSLSTELWSLLGGLPPLAPPSDLDQRARVHAQAELARVLRHQAHPWLGHVDRAWTTLAPLGLAATLLLYLSWAVDAAAALYR